MPFRVAGHQESLRLREQMDRLLERAGEVSPSQADGENAAVFPKFLGELCILEKNLG